MTALLLAFSLLGSDISVSRTVNSDYGIERILLRVGIGLLAGGTEGAAEALEGVEVSNVRIYIDGQRDGRPLGRAWRAICKLGRFVVPFGKRQVGGSVELRYELLYRGLRIYRRVTVTDGSVVSGASFACRLGPQERLKHVTVGYTATENSDGGTRFVSTISVRVNTGICPHRSSPRLVLVRRSRVWQSAIRRVNEQIDGVLAEAIREVRKMSDKGHRVAIDSILQRANGFSWGR